MRLTAKRGGGEKNKNRSPRLPRPLSFREKILFFERS
nr:MAG TPA_asm: hypothetical protein [Bacteriophage sp.]